MLGITATGDLTDVYNLEVPDCPEFFANGVLVHNSWRYQSEAWTQLMLGMRLGTHPRVVVTTTPRPTKLIKSLVKNPATHITKGSTWENVHNLAKAFTDEITREIGRAHV